MTTIKVLLLLLLFAGRRVISAGEEGVSKHGPRFDDLADAFDLNRLTDGWGRAVTVGCRDDVTNFLAALGNGSLWANKMLDASGRYSSQFLWGNSYWLGSYTLCQQLHINSASPIPGAYSVVSLRVNVTGLVTPQVRDVSLGVCLPATCNRADVLQLLHQSTSPITAVLGARIVPDPDFAVWREPGFYLLGVVIGLVTVLVVIGTGYDLILQHRAKLRHTELSGATECNGNHLSYTATGPLESQGVRKPEFQGRNPDLGSQVLLCFSAWTNLQKICNTQKEDSLACIHGLRVFSLLWVIAGHTCMFSFPVSDNKAFRQLVENDFLFQSISNGAFSVDTFFFISGVMVAYLFFKNLTKVVNTAEDGIGVIMKVSAIRFIGVFSYRYLRLTPPYLFILAITQLNAQWFYHNSVFHNPIMVRDQATCAEYWWRNVLYINTLFPVKDMCMIWSWYLANDTQFYTLGIILLLLSSKWFKLAVMSLFTFLVSSWFTTALIILNSHHMPSIEEPLGLFDELYDKPWTRLGPYVVGMCVGWFLCRTNCTIKMHKAVVLMGWALSIGMTFILVHGLYGDLGPVMSAAYVALSHTAWAIAVAWIVVACSTGNGGYVNKLLSSKFLYPLSRISYCAYLVHPLIMISVIMHMDSPVHLGRATMIVVIFGYFMMAYMLSLVVSLGFEAPTIALLNILHPIKRKMK
ncbi:nose resistant to fluoxetine protein 6-like [Zootermopsis nevadensis]|uniref:Nose resistant to fluoxetine protein 6 n=1 Tax=Zootermopsis nevadensis TaxID=136037 RepID=A0A067RF64_ZOONE|nr:nose resistant to fluoxetine protein 6-like [Zootermopsis nevadensis]KDR17635.1 Nose resistant to fluoxetine protein 6 [Zootermopsis nevadensis]